MNKGKKYLDKRFDEMKRQSILKGSSAGMVLRIILIVIILFFGFRLCNWAVKMSIDYEENTYIGRE